jgi:hypothetical protein
MKQNFTESNSNNISNKELGMIAAATVLMVIIYLFASKLFYGIGFPLDDSWIHQTYARNLALYGEWAFRPGVQSAGSTSPLWSALLSLGFLVGLSPYIWTFFLGAAVIFALALVCEWGARNIVNSYQPQYPWVAFFMIFEWHLSWAAMSGMETLLHGLIVTTILILLMTNTPRYLTLGLLTGIATWVRPDGLTLMAPVLLSILLTNKDGRSIGRAVSKYLLGFGSLFIPYLLFNLYIGGTPMPNTFYAKQAEYVAWQHKSIISRMGQMFLQLLAGPGIAIFPGVLIWVVQSIKRKFWSGTAAALWCFGYLALYMLRLPVYQHGRYIMPAMPVFFIFGLLAFFQFTKDKVFGRYHWIVKTIWQGSLALLVFAFIFIGSKAYAEDVAIIESEMVVTAKWASQNIPSDALIAVHDIGAMGYFDTHALIDLAGLISPEVIPFIKDEPQLKRYLDERGADYLIAFPDFYPLMTQNLPVIFETGSQVTIQAGEKNMAVYLWKTP